MAHTEEPLLIGGHSADHALMVFHLCGKESSRVIREASRAGCSEMEVGKAVSFISSVIGGAGFVQVSPDDSITFGVPYERPIRVLRSALREVFFHRLLSREVMCA